MKALLKLLTLAVSVYVLLCLNHFVLAVMIKLGNVVLHQYPQFVTGFTKT